MPEITVDVPPGILDRLQQIAAEKAASVGDVVRHFLTVAVGMHDTALSPDEIEARVESFGPKLPRPAFNRAGVRATVDKYKQGEPPADNR